MKCKICGNEANHLFSKKVLFQYNIAYFKCTACSFIQTENPYWLAEAYENAITALDIGLVSRNLYLSLVVRSMINAFFDKKERFLDYGGGYGLLVRMLRDEGFDFYREDKYCENLFAKGFDISDRGNKDGFELVTAFELFEHLVDPLSEVERMLSIGESILFSTDLQPKSHLLESWEYIAPETGQHIALYHYDTLQYLGKRFNMNIYSNGKNIHLLTRKKLSNNLFSLLTRGKVAWLYNSIAHSNHSLLQDDYKSVKDKLHLTNSN